MKAYANTVVSKEQMLRRLEEHRRKDAFRTGHWWADFTATGCGVGCSTHDFAPGPRTTTPCTRRSSASPVS